MATAVKKPAGKTSGVSQESARAAGSSKPQGKPAGKPAGQSPSQPRLTQANLGQNTEATHVNEATEVAVKSNAKPVRHFLVDQDLYDQARKRGDILGLQLSTVVVNGLGKFVKQAPGTTDGGAVPEAVVVALRDVAQSGDADGLSGYLLALTDAGWPMAELAEVMPAHTVPARVYKAQPAVAGKPARPGKFLTERTGTPTRQSIALRVKQARDKGLTPPKNAPVLVSPSGPALPRAPKNSGGFKKNLMVRVASDEYTAARDRAKAEGMPMSVVVRRVLTAFLDSTTAEGAKKAS